MTNKKAISYKKNNRQMSHKSSRVASYNLCETELRPDCVIPTAVKSYVTLKLTFLFILQACFLSFKKITHS